MNIGTLSVTVAANIDKFLSNINKSATAFGRFVAKINVVKTAAAGLSAVLAGAGIKSLASSLGRTAENIDAMAKAADRLNLSTEALAGLGHAANLSGVSIELLTKSLTFMHKNVGGDSSSNALERLSLNAAELKRLRADEMFLRIAAALNKVSDVSERTDIVTGIFGRGGAELLPLIQEGPEAIRQMVTEAERLGMTFNRMQAKQVEEANDALTRFQSQWEGLKQQLTISLAPAAEKAINFWISQLQQMRGMTGDFEGAQADQIIRRMTTSDFAKFAGMFEAQKAARIPASTLFGAFSPSEVLKLQESGHQAIAEAIGRRKNGPLPESLLKTMQEASDASVQDFIERLPAGARNPFDPNSMALGSVMSAIEGTFTSARSGAPDFLKKVGNVFLPPGMRSGFAAIAGMTSPVAKGMGMTPGFSMAQSGTAESYRQRAATARQDETAKLAKDDKKMQQKHATILEQIRDKIAPLMAANF